MATTTRGYPYPVGTDRVMDGDDAIHALASSVDSQVGQVQAGTLQVTPAGANTTTTVVVTFPVPFAVAPLVVVGFGSSGASMAPGVCSAWAGTSTPSSFNLSLQRANTAVQAINWIARG